MKVVLDNGDVVGQITKSMWEQFSISTLFFFYPVLLISPSIWYVHLLCKSSVSEIKIIVFSGIRLRVSEFRVISHHTGSSLWFFSCGFINVSFPGNKRKNWISLQTLEHLLSAKIFLYWFFNYFFKYSRKHTHTNIKVFNLLNLS